MKILLLLSMVLLFQSCAYHRISHDQSEMLIEGIDVDQSLEVAEFLTTRLDRDGNPKPQSLGYWSLRAQEITEEQAIQIESVYWGVIDAMEYREFHLWHYTWAIADFYRLGSPEVQNILKDAFDDAVRRGLEIEKDKFVTDTTLHLGFFHGGGWYAAKKYLVVPGERKFAQSAEEVINDK